MSNDVLRNVTQRWQIASRRTRRRWYRGPAEVGYDTIAWLCGLMAVPWLTSNLSGTESSTLVVTAVVGTCLLQMGFGLATGLYRRRHHRGSIDEVVAVSLAACGMTVALGLLSQFLEVDRRAALVTVAGAAMFALPVMLGARYVLFAARQRPRSPASAAVKIIIFGAGSAGTQLLHRLMGQSDSEYQPVALLDDDPQKRRLRIRGIPVLGDRTRLADVASRTGAAVLVIAIARPSGTVIRDLTAAAEACGLTPKVIPSIRELISGGPVSRACVIRESVICSVAGQ